MKDGLDARKGRVALGVLAFISAALFAVLIRPFYGPLIVAALLAAVLYPATSRLARAWRGRRHAAAAAMALAVLATIVVVAAGIGTSAAREIEAGLAYLRDVLGVSSVSDLGTAELPPSVEDAVSRILGVVHATREQLASGVDEATQRVRDLAPRLVAHSGRLVVDTLVMDIALFFMLSDGEAVVRWLRSVSPLQAEQTRQLMDDFRRVARGAILGDVATASLQGTAAAIGFALFHVPHAAFFGMLTALASLIPMVGTSIVWIPTCVLLVLGGHGGAALGLAVWCLVGVVGVEHLAKPFILSNIMGGELHPGLMLLSLLGGIETFGVLGTLLGPLIMALFIAVMRMLGRT